MAFLRFRRSRSVLPGVRVNLSKSGPSVSLGPRGAKLTVGATGIRTTVGLPGSGLSLTDHSSWASATKAGAKRKRKTKAVAAAMDSMTKEEQREFARKCMVAAPLPDVRAQQTAFEAHLVEHAADIEEADHADIDQMRTIYAEAIAVKQAQARRQLFLPLVLALVAGLAMWGGIANANGWVIAWSLLLLLVAAATEGGQRLLFGLMKLLFGLFGIFILLAIIGVATLVILALTGSLNS